ncbi:hypothetical protein PFISCL1PPCAC_9552, partial [Pristionchus fissidentatus]
HSIPSREWIEFITTNDMSLHGKPDFTQTEPKRQQLLKAVEHCTSFVKNELDSVIYLELIYPKMKFMRLLKNTLYQIYKSLTQFDILLKASPQFDLSVRDQLCDSWSEVSECFDRLPNIGELKNYLKSIGSDQLSITHEHTTSALTVHPVLFSNHY